MHTKIVFIFSIYIYKVVSFELSSIETMTKSFMIDCVFIVQVVYVNHTTHFCSCDSGRIQLLGLKERGTQNKQSRK